MDWGLIGAEICISVGLSVFQLFIWARHWIEKVFDEFLEVFVRVADIRCLKRV
ncbi:transmembrane protein, putative [Medicago truncatula]|nr:transmembrane protein, putative [Medicago truncatula]